MTKPDNSSHGFPEIYYDQFPALIEIDKEFKLLGYDYNTFNIHAYCIEMPNIYYLEVDIAIRGWHFITFDKYVIPMSLAKNAYTITIEHRIEGDSIMRCVLKLMKK